MELPFIQCVLVLYKQRIHQSKSLASLLRICHEDPEIAKKLRLFVQDNSPEAQAAEALDSLSGSEYYHSSKNEGLAQAYNRALVRGKTCGATWLLLLDQDTEISREYFDKLFAALEGEAGISAAAVVPKLSKDDLLMSPRSERPPYECVPWNFSGFVEGPYVGFNSGACIRIAMLDAIGGFPSAYWLDFLDHMTFHKIYQARGRVYVLDIHLTHHHSLANIEKDMSLERYSNLLGAEWQFVYETGWRGGALYHRRRLLKRAVVYFLRLNNKQYAKRTIRAVFGHHPLK